MFRCRYLIGAFAMAFALSACADSSMDEPVAEEPAPAAAAPEADVTAESVVPIPPQPKGTVEYFDMEVGDRVLFAFDSHELTDEGRLVLYRQAAWLAMFKTAEAVVEGHCDERGTREYNIALGARRAQAVKDFLASAGVSEDRIQTVSYGKERPLALCSDESCWSQNRRAVTKIAGVPSS